MTAPPLMRFIALGSLIFAGEQLNQDAPSEETARLTLSTATQSLLLNEARDALGRTLTETEVEQVFKEWENETLLVEDARRLGLADNDPILRRRLAEKMRYLLESAASAASPSDTTLRAHLARYPERFMLPPQVALDHRFFSRELRGAGMDADAQAARTALTSGRPSPGDLHPLGASLPLQTEQALTKRLGAAFARHALEAPVGSWSGPISSPTGLHVIRVTVHQPTRVATLEELRPHIESSWRGDARVEELREQLDRLRERRGLPKRRAP